MCRKSLKILGSGSANTSDPSSTRRSRILESASAGVGHPCKSPQPMTRSKLDRNSALTRSHGSIWKPPWLPNWPRSRSRRSARMSETVILPICKGTAALTALTKAASVAPRTSTLRQSPAGQSWAIVAMMSRRVEARAARAADATSSASASDEPIRGNGRSADRMSGSACARNER
jgi:hypothetical protein